MARRRGCRWLVQPDRDLHVLVLLFHHEAVVVARELKAIGSGEWHAAGNALESGVLVGVKARDLLLAESRQRHAGLGIEHTRREIDAA